MKSYLNLGCGGRFHEGWTNIDCIASGPSIVVHELRQGIPFPNESFDVVYHSHLLEHFPRAEAAPFLRECLRVLRPAGIIRIAVPDLERITKIYLQALDGALRGSEAWRHNYEWIMYELLDQTVREQSGGEMATYLSRDEIPNEAFVLQRIGIEGRRMIEGAAEMRQKTPVETGRARKSTGGLSTLHQLLHDSGFRREWIARRVLGAEYELLKLARFRRSGEVHLWMYDRYSLSQLLQEAGFRNPSSFGPAHSQIPNWKDYHLDTEPDGQVYKPDSLYMEAVK